MSKLENLKKFLDEKKKDKKSKLKIGRLEQFNVAGLESTIPTLHLAFDDLVGGLQKGTILEFYGNESSGKTTTIMKLIENIQMTQPDGEELGVLFIDCEGTANMKFMRRFKNINEDSIIFYKEFLIEEIWNTIDELVAADAIDIVVIDSVGSLQTKQEDEKDLYGNTVGSLAKRMNGLIKKFYQIAEESEMTVIVVNQQYDNPNAAMMYGGGESKILKGGNALKFAKAVSIEVKKNTSKNEVTIEKINGEDVITEVLAQYTARKNKLNAPLRNSFSLLNVLPSRAYTFNYFNDVLTYANKFGFIKQAGAWYYAYDSNGVELYKCSGGAKMVSYIQNNPTFYIGLKLQVYSKIYEPYEFYFHFKQLKDRLQKEFISIQNTVSDRLRFEDLNDEDREECEKFIKFDSGLDEKKITDFLNEKQIDLALHELKRFYDTETVEEISKRNN